ncbi:hypothetical protein [Sporosarcina sp. SAFN-010]|uniref:hypothetical protein n=1 Tax=Sporosarcina sp. SAFN-010 TaxID=3387273 RepID=UPI003F808B82
MNQYNQYNLDQPINTTLEENNGMNATNAFVNSQPGKVIGPPMTNENLEGNQAPNCRMISFTTQGTKIIRTAQLQEGSDYYFNIINLKMRNGVVGQYGNYDQVFITYAISKYGWESPMEITVPYTLSTKVDSQFMKLMSHFRTIFDGQNITLDQLVGLSGSCTIFHYQAASGAVYDQVEITSVQNCY